jgi:hypothetical protein
MSPGNILPFQRKPDPPDDGPIILGKLCRDDFELWVCGAPDGRLTLKWWRWREDMERFQALEDGGLTLDLAELRPLADLLASVGGFLDRGRLPGS